MLRKEIGILCNAARAHNERIKDDRPRAGLIEISSITKTRRSREKTRRLRGISPEMSVIPLSLSSLSLPPPSPSRPVTLEMQLNSLRSNYRRVGFAVRYGRLRSISNPPSPSPVRLSRISMRTSISLFNCKRRDVRDVPSSFSPPESK